MKIVYFLILLSSFIYSDINLHKCTECHGKEFEKSAMGISRVVKDLSEKELREALKGYSKNTHGGAMKDIMNRQLSKFTDKQIDEIVQDILDKNITNIAEKEKKEKTIEVNLGICFSCHGLNFEKSAFGTSRIVAKMSKEEIKAALYGYKEGIYGGMRNAIMANQALKLSDEEIEAVAEEIFTQYHYE